MSSRAAAKVAGSLSISKLRKYCLELGCDTSACTTKQDYIDALRVAALVAEAEEAAENGSNDGEEVP